MKETQFLAAAALLFVTTLIRADVPPPHVNVKPDATSNNAEKSYISSCIGILKNELLNNKEEEFIVLAPAGGYFTGFDSGMTDAVAQLTKFNYTGDRATDFAAIGSSLLKAQKAADALGTVYGTGMGTAYQYALVVLNSNLNPSTVGP